MHPGRDQPAEKEVESTAEIESTCTMLNIHTVIFCNGPRSAEGSYIPSLDNKYIFAFVRGVFNIFAAHTCVLI